MHRTAGVSALPQLRWRELSATDELVVLGSDGVFDVMEDGHVMRAAAAGAPGAAAAALVAEGVQKWQVCAHPLYFSILYMENPYRACYDSSSPQSRAGSARLGHVTAIVLSLPAFESA
jgi:hypothetical protein